MAIPADIGNNYHRNKEIHQVMIQFPAKASVHDHYRRIYIRIPKAAWVAYQLERLVGRLVQVSIWKPGEEKPIWRFIDHLI